MYSTVIRKSSPYDVLSLTICLFAVTFKFGCRMKIMFFEKNLPFEPDVSETVDHFWSQNISINAVDLWE